MSPIVRLDNVFMQSSERYRGTGEWCLFFPKTRARVQILNKHSTGSRDAAKCIEFDDGILCCIIQKLNTTVQGPIKGFLLLLDYLLDVALCVPNFREDVAHCVGEDAHQFVKEGFVEA